MQYPAGRSSALDDPARMLSHASEGTSGARARTRLVTMLAAETAALVVAPNVMINFVSDLPPKTVIPSIVPNSILQLNCNDSKKQRWQNHSQRKHDS